MPIISRDIAYTIDALINKTRRESKESRVIVKIIIQIIINSRDSNERQD